MTTPSISRFMTQVPHRLTESDTVARARELMITEDIRHLPVMEGGKLFGIVSMRDVDLALALAGPRDPPKLREVCEQSAFVTSPQTSLTDVATEMELRKIGCAVVMEGQTVVGIFTVVDAMRALRHAYC